MPLPSLHIFLFLLLTKSEVEEGYRRFSSDNIPLLDVYSRAVWKHTKGVSVRLSSIDNCTANPASGLMLARESKSVDRTKKLPWKVCIDRPGEERTGIKTSKGASSPSAKAPCVTAERGRTLGKGSNQTVQVLQREPTSCLHYTSI